MTINIKELEKNAQKFFEEVLLARHASKLEDLTKVKTYNINPFLISYIAKSIDGEITSMSIAKALLLPRFFGTSLNTIFGNNVQEFCVSILGLHGSTTSGIDIEYIDFVDGRKKYCQVKAGPQTINKDDVTTIVDHFKKVANLAKTNHAALQTNDMVLGVLYGSDSDLSAFYKTIAQDYCVYAGKEFWYRVTGIEDFYDRLIVAFAKASQNSNISQQVSDAISKLAQSLTDSDPEIKAMLQI